MSKLALYAKGLSKAYKIGKNRQQVLKNVNFAAYHGQVTGDWGWSVLDRRFQTFF